jgi:hypothetical protein
MLNAAHFGRNSTFVSPAGGPCFVWSSARSREAVKNSRSATQTGLGIPGGVGLCSRADEGRLRGRAPVNDKQKKELKNEIAQR